MQEPVRDGARLPAGGGHGKIVPARLGHASIARTPDLYAHATADRQRHVADALEAAIAA